PERKRLRALLGGFLQEIRGIGDRGEFWELLARRLSEGLDAEPVIPVTKAGASSASLTDGSGAPAPFDTGDVFVQRLCSEGRPLLLDEIQASGRILLDPAQAAWFEERRIALLLPLPSRDGGIGVLGPWVFEDGQHPLDRATHRPTHHPTPCDGQRGQVLGESPPPQ
ncbi:MAG TPA: hypothetical protein P5266_06950, partial [Candidatus Fermentibacter sp.]|nr:hypothetical protein [Candidatus Fermentibacter sp.]